MNLQYDGDGSFNTRLEWNRSIRLTYVTHALAEDLFYYDILGYMYRVIPPDQREEWFSP